MVAGLKTTPHPAVSAQRIKQINASQQATHRGSRNTAYPRLPYASFAGDACSLETRYLYSQLNFVAPVRIEKCFPSSYTTQTANKVFIRAY